MITSLTHSLTHALTTLSELTSGVRTAFATDFLTWEAYRILSRRLTWVSLTAFATDYLVGRLVPQSLPTTSRVGGRQRRAKEARTPTMKTSTPPRFSLNYNLLFSWHMNKSKKPKTRGFGWSFNGMRKVGV